MTTTPIFNSAATEPARREQASIAEGKAEILKKLGAATYRKMFGTAPPRTMAPPAKAAPATPASTRKAYAAEAGPFQPRKLHVYSNRAWLPELP